MDTKGSGVRQPRREADNLPPSRDGIRMGGGIPPGPHVPSCCAQGVHHFSHVDVSYTLISPH